MREVTVEAPWPVLELLDHHGLPPLPPYIARHDAPKPDDRERYQTVYARHDGSVAAPTAGLHFTPDLLGRIGAIGAEVHFLTLHVGAGTFRPLRAERVEEHRIAAENVEISGETAAAVNRARAAGRRIVAIGTTTTRALEWAATADGRLRTVRGAADLFIYPGHRFRLVDALVTNFHLPRSTLLLLAAAFCGREALLRAYRHAIAERYRFYSYGDAMLIARAMIRAHLLRGLGALDTARAQRDHASTPRGRPSGAASQLDPSHRSRRALSDRRLGCAPSSSRSSRPTAPRAPDGCAPRTARSRRRPSCRWRRWGR